MGRICGYAFRDSSRPADVALLRRMRAVLGFGGPADAREYVAVGAGLGRGRPTEVAPPKGTGRTGCGDDKIRLVLDGAIYNRRELLADLSRAGHRFRTDSDEELVARLYDAFGAEFPAHLEGAFAIALHDLRRKRILLARDQLGAKPIFYEETADGIFFGSAIAAVLAGTGRGATTSPSAVQEYLVFRYVAGERTFFEGARRLPPGHVGIWEEGGLTLMPYWRLPEEASTEEISLDEAAATLDGLLSRAMRSQVASSGRLGAFCSGGVDSGLITAYAVAASSPRIPSFSVGFDDAAWDETELARDTAERFGTDHRVLMAEPSEFASVLPGLVEAYEEPISHPNAVLIYLLARLAREQVGTVVVGEGADELFCGYPRYQIARIRGLLDPLPAWGLGGVAALVRSGPGHRAARLADLLPMKLADSIVFNSAYLGPDLVARLTGSPVDDALSERRKLLDASMVAGDVVASISRYEIRTYLVGALDRAERMATAAGIEVRAPFLDRRIVEWAVKLPSGHKVRGRQTKRVVKRLAERVLSQRITRGRKSGFGVPLGAWFRDPAFAGLVDRLRDPGHPAASLFERRLIDRLVAEHQAGTADHGEALWLLVNVYLWHEARARSGLAAVHAGGTADSATGP